jgi:PAS domain S-box-containing protein
VNIHPNPAALAAQFGDLLEFMPDAIVLVNPGGQIVLTTKIAEALFGYERRELRGKLVEELLPARFREGHVGLRSAYVAHPRNRTMGAGLELFGLRKDGSEFPVEISLSPFDNGEGSLVLTAIRDITQRKETEKALQKLSDENAMLLREMQHRIANSLQIIASILSLKAGSAQSEEARASLRDAHQRVMSVAAVQTHLLKAGGGDLIQVAPYMTELCTNLASSMIGDKRPITLSVKTNGSETGSAHAVSLGLIVTELVINAVKYAFPTEDRVGQVVVSYETAGDDWKLDVADDGVGYSQPWPAPRPGGGLGTNLVRALALQLDAQIGVLSSPAGTCVSIAHKSALRAAPDPRVHGPA